MESQEAYLPQGSQVRCDLSSQDLALVVARLTGKQSAMLADAESALTSWTVCSTGIRLGRV